MIKKDAYKHIYPPQWPLDTRYVCTHVHVCRAVRGGGLCAQSNGDNISKFGDSSFDTWLDAAWRHGSRGRRWLMCLHHGISIYVQIVCCHNGHIPSPRVCCTTHEQIDIRGVALPRGAPGDRCCSIEHQPTPACCHCVWGGEGGRSPRAGGTTPAVIIPGCWWEAHFTHGMPGT